MLYTREQIINGIFLYIDNEVMPKLSTLNKIMVGTGAALALKNSEHLIDEMLTVGKSLGVVSDEGLIDADKVAAELKSSAEKYGNVQFVIPFGGTVTFKPDDVDILRRYIS